MLQSGDFFLSITLEVLNLFVPVFKIQMPPIAKPTVQWSTKEMVSPWNRISVPVYVHLPVNAACVTLN